MAQNWLLQNGRVCVEYHGVIIPYDIKCNICAYKNVVVMCKKSPMPVGTRLKQSDTNSAVDLWFNGRISDSVNQMSS